MSSQSNQTAKPRSPVEVIEKLLAIVPVTEHGLRAGLDDALSTAHYQPPESRIAWIKIQEAFSARFIDNDNNHIPDSPAWEQQCIDVIQGRF